MPLRAGRAKTPGRAIKRTGTPRPIKRAQQKLRPIDNLKYSIERSIATSLRSGLKKKGISRVYRHGNCPVNHRTPEAAARCRNA